MQRSSAFGRWGALTLILLTRIEAQNRGVYPLGMNAVNSGLMPAPGFTYTNQLLSYARDEAKANDGSTLPVTGSNTVVMDLNTIAWSSETTVPGGAQYAASATLPFARNDLTSDLNGNLSGGAGFADSYYLPLILGWDEERAAVRVLWGFLAPTGRFAQGANSKRRLRILDLHRVKRANVLSDKEQIAQPLRLRDVRIPYHAGRHRNPPGGHLRSGLFANADLHAREGQPAGAGRRSWV